MFLKTYSMEHRCFCNFKRITGAPHPIRRPILPQPRQLCVPRGSGQSWPDYGWVLTSFPFAQVWAEDREQATATPPPRPNIEHFRQDNSLLCSPHPRTKLGFLHLFTYEGPEIASAGAVHSPRKTHAGGSLLQDRARKTEAANHPRAPQQLD